MAKAFSLNKGLLIGVFSYLSCINQIHYAGTIIFRKWEKLGIVNAGQGQADCSTGRSRLQSLKEPRGQGPFALVNVADVVHCVFIHHAHSLLCQRELWFYSEGE